jgi:hypothetical protein
MVSLPRYWASQHTFDAAKPPEVPRAAPLPDWEGMGPCSSE